VLQLLFFRLGLLVHFEDIEYGLLALGLPICNHEAHCIWVAAVRFECRCREAHLPNLWLKFGKDALGGRIALCLGRCLGFVGSIVQRLSVAGASLAGFLRDLLKIILLNIWLRYSNHGPA